MSGYRNEQIVSAQHVSRPKEMKGPTVADHHGVRVQTDKGNSYLIHSTPSSGTVVTDAKMSNKWHVDHNIPVSGQKTVGQVFKEASGRTTNSLVNYVTSGTCINTAKNAEAALKK